MPPGDVAPLIAVVVITLCVAAVAIFRGPLGRAIARRLDPGSTPDDGVERISHLEARIAELELLANRVDDLENRVDFSERLLASVEDRARMDFPDA